MLKSFIYKRNCVKVFWILASKYIGKIGEFECLAKVKNPLVQAGSLIPL